VFVNIVCCDTFRNFYVRADKVFHLRHLLDKSSSVQGLMSEEKGKQNIISDLNHIVTRKPS